MGGEGRGGGVGGWLKGITFELLDICEKGSRVFRKRCDMVVGRGKNMSWKLKRN